MNAGYTYPDTIAARFAGKAVLDFYAECYPKAGREVWRDRIGRGLVRLNGRVISSGEEILRAGDRLEYVRPPWEEPPAPTDLPVLFEDDDLLVVNKPAGLPVLPGGGFLETTVTHLLRAHEARWRGINPVHCLDRGTSGLLILGKNRAALSALGRDLMRHRVWRIYLAVLEGLVEKEQFTVAVPIGREAHPRLGFIEAASAQGKPSRTDFRVLARDESAHTTLVEAAPYTGRTHQIRIHAAFAGHPLHGEPFFIIGGKWDAARAATADSFPLPGGGGFRLHSWQARFGHPRTGEEIRLTCLPPEGFWRD